MGFGISESDIKKILTVGASERYKEFRAPLVKEYYEFIGEHESEIVIVGEATTEARVIERRKKESLGDGSFDFRQRML